eukprot:gnl/TRDRNA2_/TRDRNA2_171972_c2_seq2.p2 gnl/TRDRNA2_/TRDRNA2_171972_c2~~gnl/TRDRNA2_/TRDRNA2_171972_c2_seq2.p2  ORF type:complete len:159 (+),score=28.74 gnl/TRDRNA2_/TRDRNA2_171972_c2_seq2:146-622(+)
MDEKLFQVLARAAEMLLSEFNAQDLANMSWACAKMGQFDEKLFAVLGSVAEQLIREFNAQELANTIWAFSQVGSVDVALLKVLATAAQQNMADFSEPEIGMILWASSRCDSLGNVWNLFDDAIHARELSGQMETSTIPGSGDDSLIIDESRTAGTSMR